MATATKPAAPTVPLSKVAAELAEKTGMTKKDATGALDEFIGLVVKHLKKGNKVRITGLGILQVRAVRHAWAAIPQPARRSRSRPRRRSPSASPRISRKRSKRFILRIGRASAHSRARPFLCLIAAEVLAHGGHRRVGRLQGAIDVGLGMGCRQEHVVPRMQIGAAAQRLGGEKPALLELRIVVEQEQSASAPARSGAAPGRARSPAPRGPSRRRWPMRVDMRRSCRSRSTDLAASPAPPPSARRRTRTSR